MRFCGDYICACAAADDIHVNADAALRLIEFCDARNLQRLFVDGVDPFFGFQSTVGRAARNAQLDFTHSFARSF
jgi:hypothetical protein